MHVHGVSVVALGRAGCVLGGLDGCEVRLCDPCARVRPGVPCVSGPCVSRLPALPMQAGGNVGGVIS